MLERFPAGAPRGSWPAEEFAAARRAEGVPAEVVMDLATDTFLVVRPDPNHAPAWTHREGENPSWINSASKSGC